MYIEILIIAIIVFGLLILNTRIDTTRLYKENQGLFDLLKEKDYEFLLRAKYGDNVIDPDSVFRKKIKQLTLFDLELLTSEHLAALFKTSDGVMSF